MTFSSGIHIYKIYYLTHFLALEFFSSLGFFCPILILFKLMIYFTISSTISIIVLELDKVYDFWFFNAWMQRVYFEQIGKEMKERD